MSGMAVGATGNPDRLEQPPQQITAHQRHADEGEPDGQVFGKTGRDPEPWEHHDLSRDGQNVADDAHSTAVADLATQDSQISQLAQAFASDIPTGTLQDLRVAATRGKQAIDLRAAIARLTTALTTRLATPDRATAEAALVVLPLQQAEAEQIGRASCRERV